MVEGGGAASGKLYCLASGAPGASSKILLTGIAISNSICFSPDGRQMYFADTPHRMIERYDLDPHSGAISNRQLFARTPPGAYPDGSHVDAQGHLWNAQWGSGKVVRYVRPTGRSAARSTCRRATSAVSPLAVRIWTCCS
jgi:sugar lactone lactonase YvrE